ncbi:MAG: Bax inhibitor-1/YccA family protein [Alphaproteobacteria bacterium]|nr:Bax inhibitor-1/YccA family protein [Alphaproteobacteria bacterium]
MAENWSNNQTTQAAEAKTQAVDEGLRIYMTKVYNYMGLGLLATAITAYIGAASGIYVALAQTPLIWLVVLAPLGMVIYLSSRLHKMSASAAKTTFWIYAAMTGLSLSYVLLAFTGVSVVRTFLITAASFGALSLYGYTTKRDLSGMGSFLFMGLIGIILASIVNIFMQSPAMHFAISVIGVLLFAGLTAYDTQDIKRIYYAGDSRDIAEKKAIMGALRLYLDFINMFLFLLQFLGNRD